MTGAELKVFRESKSLTQAQFAQLIGLKREKTISDYERGDLTVPDWLIKLVELMRASKPDIEMLDNGITPPDALLIYLDAHFETHSGQDTIGKQKGYQITRLDNHKGNWTVGFEGVPEVKVLLAIFLFFETDQSFDGLEQLIFNQDSVFEKTFRNVAGCLGDRFGAPMSEAIAFAAKEAERKNKEWRKTLA